MDHEVVVRQKLTERYLLNELDSEARDQFEEHYFDCPTCALDVRAGSTFVDQTKAVLAATRESENAFRIKPAPAPPRPNWLTWLRPAFAAPALAVLLAVAGYQNLVTIPKMAQAVNNPQVLPWVSVNVGAFGDAAPQITAAPGKGFLMFVRVPPQGGYSQRTADLYDPAGKREWSVPIPETVSQGQMTVSVPGADRQPGSYTVVLHGITASGVTEELGRGTFELQILK
jgi:hypothetical protein